MHISYKKHCIPKGNGKYRILYEPNAELKKFQLDSLQKMYLIKPHKCNHGFVPGKSIATNANQHVGKKWVLSFDIKSFFPNTKAKKVESLQ